MLSGLLYILGYDTIDWDRVLTKVIKSATLLLAAEISLKLMDAAVSAP